MISVATRRLLRRARATGYANLAGQNLTEIPKDLLDPMEYIEKDEKAWECQVITRVDLSFNNLLRLPENIETSLSSLISLKLRGNELQRLPNSICGLNQLTVLDVSKNSIEKLPVDIGLLRELKYLDVSCNQIVELPDSICDLNKLESLSMESNGKVLKALPPSIGRLSSLRKLTAADCGFWTLPGSIGDISHLKILNLKGNSLSCGSLAPIESLHELHYLDASNNQIQDFPPLPSSIMTCQLSYNQISAIDVDTICRGAECLLEFHIRNNRLTSIPMELHHCKNLHLLDVRCNSISALPHVLGYMPSLDKLLLEGNPLRSVRQSLLTCGTVALKEHLKTRGPSPPNEVEGERGGRQTSWTEGIERASREAYHSKTLELSELGLEEFPSSTFEMDKFPNDITTVNLKSNNLVTVPSNLSQFSHLEAVDCSRNCITSISPDVRNLRLTHLMLEGNRLSACNACESLNRPGAVLHETLQELDLSSNRLVDVPVGIFRCRGLRVLLLAQNLISTISHLPWCSLNKLEVLNLSSNKISSLGDIMCMTWLLSLDISNNELQTIPPELSFCTSLQSITLHGNPQRMLRQAVLDKGTSAVIAYLEGRLPQGHQPPQPRVGCLS